MMFSYARNSCSRNHQRYTLCCSHFNEGHKGSWQDCKKCRKDFETEMYATSEPTVQLRVWPIRHLRADPMRCNKSSSSQEVAP
jgi:hypothetical protein